MSNFRTYPVISDLGLMDEAQRAPGPDRLGRELVAWLVVCAVALA